MKYFKPLLRNLASNGGLFCSDGSAASGDSYSKICQTGTTADSTNSDTGCTTGDGDSSPFGLTCSLGNAVNLTNSSACVGGNGV